MSLLLLVFFSFCPATLAERNGYTVCYDTQNQRALWTAHRPKHSMTPTARKHWRQDHELNSLPSAAFTNSGFDRGHLATAADLPDSEDAVLTSSAIAQNQIRNRQATHVITGALHNHCGNDKIEAPCYIYKIAILEDGQILAHFAPNAESRPR